MEGASVSVEKNNPASTLKDVTNDYPLAGGKKPIYKITLDKKNDFMYLDPINGKPHQSTFIFIHDINESAETNLEFFTEYEKYGLVPKDCRIVLPCS